MSRNFRLAWDSANACRDAVPCELRHHYAIASIDSRLDLGLSFEDRLVYLSRSMGHSVLESTVRYYALTPMLADVVERCSAAGFDAIVPEVGHEEA